MADRENGQRASIPPSLESPEFSALMSKKPGESARIRRHKKGRNAAGFGQQARLQIDELEALNRYQEALLKQFASKKRVPLPLP